MKNKSTKGCKELPALCKYLPFKANTHQESNTALRGESNNTALSKDTVELDFARNSGWQCNFGGVPDLLIILW